MSPWQAPPLAFVDVETSGLDPLVHEVLEVSVLREGPFDDLLDRPLPPGAMWRQDHWGRYLSWETKVRPIRLERAEAEALRINGYLNDPLAWAEAPLFAEISRNLERLLHKTDLVAHNASFDEAFLKSELRRAGSEDPRPWSRVIDTCTLAHEHLPPGASLRLDNVCRVLHIQGAGHRAGIDTLRCREVYHRMFRAGWIQRMRWRAQAYRLNQQGAFDRKKT